jgi:hypothetical protein
MRTKFLIAAVAAFALATSASVALAAPKAPANDMFTSVVQSASTSPLPLKDGLNSTGATMEAGEPGANCSMNPVNNHSVWYEVKPTAGAHEVNTFGSNYDTVVAIYTGGSLSSLVQVDCNDDANNSTLQSQLFFTADGSTTYRIQVGSYWNDGGHLVTNIK